MAEASPSGVVTPRTQRPMNSNTGPYLMPDGRPFGAFVVESRTPEKRARTKHQRARKKIPQHGWTVASSAGAWLSCLDETEVNSLNKLGQRKQRRYVNDFLLREMTAELTADGIDALFKPVPFGNVHAPKSAFYQVSQDNDVHVLWQMFLSVNADTQERILKKWEKHVRELREEMHHHGTAQDDGQEQQPYPSLEERKKAVAQDYARRWRKNVSLSGKSALKKTHRQTLYDIESYMLPCLSGEVSFADVHAEDGFGRLLTHSIATLHGLESRTLERTDDGQRFVRVSGLHESHDGGCHLYCSIGDFVSAMPNQCRVQIL
ncbi:hypothetical protein M9434_006180 [Picochlorum sp. BPE23]|nr:hypothetical protein M9434_006180 [Picochlorum sp. BPE23]